MRHPLLLPIEKNVYSMYVKTTHMLTILREAEEWTRVHLREAVRECNYEKLALRTSKRQSACTSNNFTLARPLMGTIFLVCIYLNDKQLFVY